jgi:hypothetical protein
MGLLVTASVAIDGSKFKAVNNRDRNYTRTKVERRRAQLEQSVARYLSQLDSADRQEPSEALATKTTRLKEKLAKLAEEMRRLDGIEAQMLSTPDQQISEGLRTLSAILSAPGRQKAGAAPRPKESTWAGPLPSPRRNRKRPSGGARRARRSMNSPAATTLAGRRFHGSEANKGEGFSLNTVLYICSPL